jgi:hypothetical protein
MQLEIVRLVADIFKSGTFGVNAVLAQLPVYADDTRPPEVALIADETRDVCVAQRRPPLQTPALYVIAEEPFQVDTRHHWDPYQDAASFAVSVRYFCGYADTDRAVRDTLYSLRACCKSITRWSYDAPVTERVRNEVFFINAPRIQYGLWREEVGGSYVTGAMLLYLSVRDNKPR